MLKKVLLVLAGLVLLLVTAVLVIGLWNGSGTIFDFLAGQFPAQPTTLDAAASSKPAAGSYAVQVAIDLRRPVGSLPDEYLSFAIDASQVVGGKWWNPKADAKEMGSGTLHAPIFNFNRPQLDRLVQGLTPAYLRIGGSESDKIYYDLQSDSAGEAPPPGYQSILSRSQWDQLNAFASRNGLQVVFTLNAGPGPRDSTGAWDPTNAAELIDYTARQGYPVRVWELGNELNIGWFVHGFKKQVPVRQYIQDLGKLRATLDQSDPHARLGGQGSAIWPVLGEPLGLFYGYLPGSIQPSAAYVDQLSWHYYPQQSRRGPIASRRASPARMLDPRNLDEAGTWAERMRSFRDQYAPEKPIWLGETGNAQFGGEPGLSDMYLGGLWWLDELGLLAKKDTQVVVRQSLTGMNYSLIDDETLAPRPDYWNSLLWKRFMGNQVYDVSISGNPKGHLRAYAASTPGAQGFITVLLINLDPTENASISLPGFRDRPYEVYALNAPDLFGQTVLLNGEALNLDANGALPVIHANTITNGNLPTIQVNPLSYTFVVFYPPLIPWCPSSTLCYTRGKNTITTKQSSLLQSRDMPADHD